MRKNLTLLFEFFIKNILCRFRLKIVQKMYIDNIDHYCRYTVRLYYVYIYIYIYIYISRSRSRERERETDRQTDRHRERETDIYSVLLRKSA